MKKAVNVSVFLVLLLFSLYSSNADNGAEEDPFGLESGEQEISTYEDLDHTPLEITQPETEEEQPTAEIPDDQTFQVNSVPETYNVQTNDGTIKQFSMTNALFSLGSLVQGSFLSFTNNNNIYWKSLFDASSFQATVDEGAQVDVAQRNSFGELGKVVVSIDSGNLTQDGSIVYVPEGNEPTYIYYNTTEIEFKDGSIYLLGESVTNDDESKDTTTVAFDENGFSRIQLLPDNTYTSFDYALVNTDDDDLYICKKDPLCDINIDESTFTINGRVNFSFQEDIVYQSVDPNNVFTIDVSTGAVSLSNAKPRNTVLAYVSTGHHMITETKDAVYDMPVAGFSPSLIQSYASIPNDKVLTFDDETLVSTNFKSFIPGTTAEEDCWESGNGTC